MFCSTECWDCEDRTCEHYISKSKLYFENHQLKDRIEKATKYIGQELLVYDNESDEYNVGIKLLKILKGEENE